MSTILTFYFSGIASATFGVSGIFFLRLWKLSGDRLFLALCATFWLLAIERHLGLGINAMLGPEVANGDAARSAIYLCRLFAFGILFLAIVQKNRRSG